MSKNTVAAKESGAHSFKDKGHLKRNKYEGAHDTKKHGQPLKEQGAHDAGKPIVPVEVDGAFHSGRKLPTTTRLSDSTILKGHVEKRDEN
jgi:hypothetical protein